MRKNHVVKSFFLGMVFLSAGFSAQKADAQVVTTGVGVGGLGGQGYASGIAWGLNLNINSLGWAAFHADLLFAPTAQDSLFALSPGFAFYPIEAEGFLLGGILGLGFYKVGSNSTNFGFSYGIVGDFLISKKLSVGMTAKQHILTNGDADYLWGVMMTLGYKFEGGGDW